MGSRLADCSRTRVGRALAGSISTLHNHLRLFPPRRRNHANIIGWPPDNPSQKIIAQEIAAAAPLAVKSMRCTLRQDLIALLEKALEHELDEQVRLWGTEDFAIGIQSARERQVPAFVGR